MKTISVVDLEWTISTSEAIAQFGGPIEKIHEISLVQDGLRDPQTRAIGCLGWIWRQWLAATRGEVITTRVEPFVERCLELRARCKCYDWLPQHDLLVLVCAILASGEAQLEKVVKTVADTSGDKGAKPVNNGELYAAAWCGMMKHWVLGNLEKASDQSSLIWGAYHDQIICAATKPLVMPWLKRDWSAFLKAQQKDFDKLWQRGRKARWTVKSETEQEVVMATRGVRTDSDWCWAHCGMALLAYRQFGVGVATDAFWFPPHALKCVGRNSFSA